jgi:CMP/dCMP kinase
MIKSGIKIAISGKSGCGNTTLSKLVAERYGLQFINYTLRNMAQEMGMNLEDLLRLAEADEQWDRKLDAKQRELSAPGNCVLGSRLAIWLLPDADLRVYLQASPEVRGARIFQRQGGDRMRTVAETQERDRRDRERYLRLYQIDNDDFDSADLILDSGVLSPEALLAQINQALRQRNLTV